MLLPKSLAQMTLAVDAYDIVIMMITPLIDAKSAPQCSFSQATLINFAVCGNCAILNGRCFTRALHAESTNKFGRKFRADNFPTEFKTRAARQIILYVRS